MQVDKLIIMQMLSALLAEPYSFDYTDLSGNHTLAFTPSGVFRGRKTVSAQEAPWAISVLEAPRATVGSPAGVEGEARAEDWTLNVQGWPPEDRFNPSDPAYLMAAAVRQRLARLIDVRSDETGSTPVDQTYHLFGNRVNRIAFGATIVTPATEGLSEVAFWYMPLVVSLVQRTRTG